MLALFSELESLLQAGWKGAFINKGFCSVVGGQCGQSCWYKFGRSPTHSVWEAERGQNLASGISKLKIPNLS